jgi:phosphoribosylformylglycinamidine cyclo-ligase
MQARIDADSWEQPRLMAFLQAQGHIEPGEMAKTFNCGIGMAIVVAAHDAAAVTTALEAAGEKVHRIGSIVGGAGGCVVSGSVETWSAQHAWEASHGA